MKKLKWIGISILAVLGLIIIFQNIETVKTTVLFFSFEMPRAILLFLTMLIGFIIGLLTSYFLIKGESSTP